MFLVKSAAKECACFPLVNQVCIAGLGCTSACAVVPASLANHVMSFCFCNMLSAVLRMIKLAAGSQGKHTHHTATWWKGLCCHPDAAAAAKANRHACPAALTAGHASLVLLKHACLAARTPALGLHCKNDAGRGRVSWAKPYCNMLLLISEALVAYLQGQADKCHPGCWLACKRQRSKGEAAAQRVDVGDRLAKSNAQPLRIPCLISTLQRYLTCMSATLSFPLTTGPAAPACCWASKGSGQG